MSFGHRVATGLNLEAPETPERWYFYKFGESMACYISKVAEFFKDYISDHVRVKVGHLVVTEPVPGTPVMWPILVFCMTFLCCQMPKIETGKRHDEESDATEVTVCLESLVTYRSSRYKCLRRCVHQM